MSPLQKLKVCQHRLRKGLRRTNNLTHLGYLGAVGFLPPPYYIYVAGLCFIISMVAIATKSEEL